MVLKKEERSEWKIRCEEMDLGDETSYSKIGIFLQHSLVKEGISLVVTQTSNEDVLFSWLKETVPDTISKNKNQINKVLGFSFHPFKNDAYISRLVLFYESHSIMFTLQEARIPDVMACLFETKYITFVGIDMVKDQIKSTLREKHDFDVLKGAAFNYQMIADVIIPVSSPKKQLLELLRDFVNSMDDKLQRLSCQWSALQLPELNIRYSAVAGYLGLQLFNC